LPIPSSAATATATVLFRKSLRCIGACPPHHSFELRPSWLELHLQGKLNLALRYHCRGDHTGRPRPIRDERIRQKSRMIKGIKKLSPELNAHLFLDIEKLVDR